MNQDELDAALDHHGFTLLEGFDDLALALGETELVYLHDLRTGKAVAVVLPLPGWWSDRLPAEAPPEHFSHDHATWRPT